jgi:hypothetical protein
MKRTVMRDMTRIQWRLSGSRERRLFGWLCWVGGRISPVGLLGSGEGDSPVQFETESLVSTILLLHSFRIDRSWSRSWSSSHLPVRGVLTSTLTPASALAFNCCSVAVIGLSELVWACGESWIDSSGSAGVTEDVDLRGGIFGSVEPYPLGTGWPCRFSWVLVGNSSAVGFM